MFINAIVTPSKSSKQGSSSLCSDCKLFFMLLFSSYELFLFLKNNIYLFNLVSYSVLSLAEY